MNEIEKKLARLKVAVPDQILDARILTSLADSRGRDSATQWALAAALAVSVGINVFQAIKPVTHPVPKLAEVDINLESRETTFFSTPGDFDVQPILERR